MNRVLYSDGTTPKIGDRVVFIDKKRDYINYYMKKGKVIRINFEILYIKPIILPQLVAL